jgi:large subunit ribosomal protein L37Ae
MVKTKIVKSAGRFGIRYGISVRRRITAIEEKQRKKQLCIFCKGRAKRISKGIWLCQRCGKKFAGHAYYLEQPPQVLLEQKLAAMELKDKKEKKAKDLKDKNALKEVEQKETKSTKTRKTKKTTN